MFVETIQTWDSRWVFADFKGKGKKPRTVAIPAETNDVIEKWLEAARIPDGSRRVARFRDG